MTSCCRWWWSSGGHSVSVYHDVVLTLATPTSGETPVLCPGAKQLKQRLCAFRWSDRWLMLMPMNFGHRKVGCFCVHRMQWNRKPW